MDYSYTLRGCKLTQEKDLVIIMDDSMEKYIQGTVTVKKSKPGNGLFSTSLKHNFENII